MTNSIHSAFAGGIGQAHMQKTGSAAAAKDAKVLESQVRPNDAAAISSTSTNLAAALRSDDTRFDKVAAIRAAIADGRYTVPASAVADRIIDSIIK